MKKKTISTSKADQKIEIEQLRSQIHELLKRSPEQFAKKAARILADWTQKKPVAPVSPSPQTVKIKKVG